MHILQPKHSKLNEKESEEFLSKLNISKSQLPKILLTDPALPEGCGVGDLIKIERKPENPNEKKEQDKVNLYFRVVV